MPAECATNIATISMQPTRIARGEGLWLLIELPQPGGGQLQSNRCQAEQPQPLLSLASQGKSSQAAPR